MLFWYLIFECCYVWVWEMWFGGSWDVIGWWVIKWEEWVLIKRVGRFGFCYELIVWYVMKFDFVVIVFYLLGENKICCIFFKGSKVCNFF